MAVRFARWAFRALAFTSKIFVYFKACVHEHERIIYLLPLPIRIAHPGATSDCTPIAQYTPRHRPSLYMPYTIHIV